MRTALFVIAALGLSAPAFAADPVMFTFKTADQPATVLGNGDIMGMSYTGKMWTTWADGKKTESTYTCVTTSNPPSDRIFHTTTVCDGKSADGNYTSIWGCNLIDKAKMTVGCVGGLYGQTGSFAGRAGAATFSGATGGGVGTGQWGG